MKSVTAKLMDKDLKVFFDRSLSREKSRININTVKSTIQVNELQETTFHKLNYNIFNNKYNPFNF